MFSFLSKTNNYKQSTSQSAGSFLSFCDSACWTRYILSHRRQTKSKKKKMLPRKNPITLLLTSGWEGVTSRKGAINFPKIVQQSLLYLELRRPGRLLDWRGALWAQTLTGAKSHRLRATDEISALSATKIEKGWRRRASRNADALTEFDKSGAEYRQRPLALPRGTGRIFGFRWRFFASK